MTLLQLLDILRAKIGTEVEDVLDVPVGYDNAAFSPPADGSPFVLATVQLGDNDLVTTGTPATYRQHGIVYFQVYTESNIGDKVGMEMAQTIIEAFRNKSENGVLYFTPRPGTPGTAGGNWLVTVSCPFQADTFA